MRQLRQNKEVRVFAWTVFNAVVTYCITLVTGSEYAVFVLPILNVVTKYINTTYFNDL